MKDQKQVSLLLDSLFILRKYINFLVKDDDELKLTYSKASILNEFNSLKIEHFKARESNIKNNEIELFRKKLNDTIQPEASYFLADNLSINSNYTFYIDFIENLFNDFDVKLCLGIPVDPIELLIVNFQINIETYGYSIDINRYIDNLRKNGNKLHLFYFKLLPYLINKFENRTIIPTRAGVILDTNVLNDLADYVEVNVNTLDNIENYNILFEPIDIKFYSYLKSSKFRNLELKLKHKSLSTIRQLQKYYLIDTSIYNMYIPQISSYNLDYLKEFKDQSDFLISQNSKYNELPGIQVSDFNSNVNFNYIEL